MSANVGILIVSHSHLLAEGVADMVRQMVGEKIPLGWCGGNADGGLGTDLDKIKQKMEETWTPKGLAVLVDVGGAETNSEMAVGMLDPAISPSVVICDAPIVEGAIMAAAEASSGSPLEVVVKTAEESFS